MYSFNAKLYQMIIDGYYMIIISVSQYDQRFILKQSEHTFQFTMPTNITEEPQHFSTKGNNFLSDVYRIYQNKQERIW